MFIFVSLAWSCPSFHHCSIFQWHRYGISALYTVEFSWHDPAALSPWQHLVVRGVAATSSNNKYGKVLRTYIWHAKQATLYQLFWARAPEVWAGDDDCNCFVVLVYVFTFQAHLMKHRNKLHCKAASSGFTDAQKSVVDHILIDKINARRKVRNYYSAAVVLQ